MTQSHITIIGAGLAGSEAAWQAANAGTLVTLYEMRPKKSTFAHQSGDCAELVCSNSFRSDDTYNNAVGLLHEEMRRCNSLIMRCGDAHKVPAGGALAVDREHFAQSVTQALHNHPNITFKYEEITSLNDIEGDILIATGPLTSDALANDILQLTGSDYLSFFDAIAPIINKDSINMDKAWFQSRYDKGDGADYINCPMSEEEYNHFLDELLLAEKTEFKEWEKNTPYFEGCLPIEVMAERGRQTLTFGPMKPVGLTNPHSEEKPYAVVQLRQDNKLGTLYNMVGFQTKLKWGEQKRIFRMIPGLENAEFARLGGIHRNTFINSPELLNTQLQLKSNPRIRFAGQITGVEGYVESAATGLLAGRYIAKVAVEPPLETALGALTGHIAGGADAKTFQPMNVNFGLFPSLTPPAGKKKVQKRDRPKMYADRALNALSTWIDHKHAA